MVLWLSSPREVLVKARLVPALPPCDLLVVDEDNGVVRQLDHESNSVTTVAGRGYHIRLPTVASQYVCLGGNFHATRINILQLANCATHRANASIFFFFDTNVSGMSRATCELR